MNEDEIIDQICIEAIRIAKALQIKSVKNLRKELEKEYEKKLVHKALLKMLNYTWE